MPKHTNPFWPTFGAGIPGATVTKSQLYYDNSVMPVLAYVWDRTTSTWKLAGDGGSGGPFLPTAGGIMSGAIKAWDGLAGTPGIYWQNIQGFQNGFYNETLGATSDNIGVVTGGQKRFAITANGKLIWYSTLTENNGLVVGGQTPTVQVQGNSANNASLAVIKFAANAAATAEYLVHSRSTVNTAFAKLVAGDGIGRNSHFYDTGTLLVEGAAIQSSMVSDGDAVTVQTDLLFFTRNNTGSGALNTPALKIRFDNSITDSANNIIVDANRGFQRRVFTFATLPVGVDQLMFSISNSSVVATGNYGNAAAAGGTNHVPVYFDGGTATWRIG